MAKKKLIKKNQLKKKARKLKAKKKLRKSSRKLKVRKKKLRKSSKKLKARKKKLRKSSRKLKVRKKKLKEIKGGKTQKLKKGCQRCGNSTLVTDHKSGKTFCSKCGFSLTKYTPPITSVGFGKYKGKWLRTGTRKEKRQIDKKLSDTANKAVRNR